MVFNVRVLDLCRQLCPEKIPVTTDQYLGDGADGEVFTIVGENYKIIKFSIIYDRFRQKPKNIYHKKILPILDYVMTQSPHVYVRVYEYGYLGEYNRKMAYWKDGLQNFVIHYCIMEKLLKLTEDEKKVFHSVISHEDRGIKKDLSADKVSEILDGLTCGLDFDAEMVKLFCNNLRESKLKHNDLHYRNIMRNNDGYFKVIDLDRCQLV